MGEEWLKIDWKISPSIKWVTRDVIKVNYHIIAVVINPTSSLNFWKSGRKKPNKTFLIR